MTNDEQRRRLKQLLKDSLITQEMYDAAIAKVPEEKKLDIYNNQQGELCIILKYKGYQWIIRIPVLYDVPTYIREKYPMDSSKQGRKNQYLWKIISENRVKIAELDRQRKVQWITSKEPVKQEKKPEVKSRVLTVTESGRYGAFVPFRS